MLREEDEGGGREVNRRKSTAKDPTVGKDGEKEPRQSRGRSVRRRRSLRAAARSALPSPLTFNRGNCGWIAQVGTASPEVSESINAKTNQLKTIIFKK